MSVESYIYDEPVGIYGHESHERLARGVLQDLVRYEEALKADDSQYSLPGLEAEDSITHPEEFRISSIVESRDARLGYALALANPEASPSALGGVLYRIDREDPAVLEDKTLVVARPETFQSNQDYQAQIDGLMERFDKGELEVIMRMLGKMTSSLELSREMHTINDDDLSALSVAGSMKQAAKTQRMKSILKRVAGVEPYVLGALHIQRQKELHSLFPDSQLFAEKAETPPANEHLLDWTDFVEAADKLIKNEADQASDVAHVNVHYEVDGKLYYLKLVAEQGELTGVQMLCDDTGAWKSQLFELNTSHDEEADLNIVSPIWDKPDIIDSLQNGEIIDDKRYEVYRQLAEKSIEDSFSNPEKLIQLPYASS